MLPSHLRDNPIGIGESCTAEAESLTLDHVGAGTSILERQDRATIRLASRVEPPDMISEVVLVHEPLLALRTHEAPRFEVDGVDVTIELPRRGEGLRAAKTGVRHLKEGME